MRNAFLAVVLVLVAAGCQPAATPAPASKVVSLAKGTPVELMLAKQIDAGAAQEGEFVPLLVAKDVCDADGNVLIPKGSVVTGEVKNSRSEGTLSGLMNRPARLDIAIKEVQLPNQVVASLAADPEKPDEVYRFTRENTGKPSGDDAKIEDLLKDEVNRQLAEKLSSAFNGQTPDLSTPEAKEALSHFASELGLNDTKKLLDSGKGDVQKISGAIDRLQHGDISGLMSGDLTLTLSSITELANLAGGLGDRLSRTLKGRTIHAYPGTTVRAYLKDNFSTAVVADNRIRS